MPGKVRTCCLYKYPSWIQDLIVTAQQQEGQKPPTNNYSSSETKSQRSATTTTVPSGQRFVLATLKSVISHFRLKQ